VVLTGNTILVLTGNTCQEVMTRNLEKSALGAAGISRRPPRERILAVASELFYRRGIRAVGVEAIAEAAGTNKMTLYRHFASKDDLVAEYLRRLAGEADRFWDEIAAAHPGDPRAQLRVWLKRVGERCIDSNERGCALTNAAIELPDKDHPARRVIEEFKRAQRERLVELCRAGGLSEPELLADELFLLLEGARVCAQSLGPAGPAARLARMGEAIVASHASAPG
jgi:AcrR family transcriptional regulator